MISNAILLASLVLAADPVAQVVSNAQPGIRVSRTISFGAQSAVGVPISLPQGRFVAVDREDGKPALLIADPPDAVRIVKVKPGAVLIGIRFDAPADAEEQEYSFPESKGAVYAIIAKAPRNGSAKCVIRSIVNSGKDDVEPLMDGQVTIQIVGSVKPNPPTPGPTPNPKPDDGGQAILPTDIEAICIVEETENAAANRANQFADPAIKEWISRKQVIWRCVDKDVLTFNPITQQREVPADLAPYLKIAKEGKIPMIFIVGKGGKRLYSGDVPSGSLLDFLKKYGGN